MTKKKIFSILLIMLCTVTLAGCDLFDKDDDKPVTNNTTTTETEQKTDNASTNTNTYVGDEKAKNIALTDAGVKEADARELSVELDTDSSYGKVIYDIDFKANGKEYDYDIDATTGKILNKTEDIDD